jgi:hypothetical protein
MLGAPVKGTFLLTPSGSFGSFKTYAVTGVNWVVSQNGMTKTVTGSGTYKVGGSSAPQQELSLNLQINGGAVQHFDSGLVPESVLFPNIKVSISLHGQVCFDTVFNIDASPLTVPPLHAAVASPQAVALTWPASSDSFVLQQTSDLGLSQWETVTNHSALVKGQNQVILDRSPGTQFYRLVPAE